MTLLEILPSEQWLFGLFGIIMVLYLIVDLGFRNKEAHKVSTSSASIETLFWVAVAGIFAGLIYYYVDLTTTPEHKGAYKSIEFVTAYLTEYALSVDNIFVILLILRYFHIKEMYYHKVLFWGILGAVVFRAIFIFLGAMVIHKFHFILYGFGLFLLFTGVKMLLDKDNSDDNDDFDPNSNFVVKIARKFLRFTATDYGDKFFVKENGKVVFTTLFLSVLMIESTDLIFAVDSIPAVFGVSTDEFVIYTSNMFAVMGLRSMFFMLSGIIDKFYLLPKGLALVLSFIGIKMLIDYWHIEIPDLYSLLFIVLSLGGSVALSIYFPQKEKETENKEKVQS